MAMTVAALVFAADLMSVVQEADLVIASSRGALHDTQDEARWARATWALATTSEQASQSWTEARAPIDPDSLTWNIVRISLSEEPQAKGAGELKSPIIITFQFAQSVAAFEGAAEGCPGDVQPQSELA